MTVTGSEIREVGQSRRVLLVTNDADEARRIHEHLSVEDCAVLAATDGAEALLELGADPADVAIIDTAIPRIGALDLLETLKSRDAGLPVIMLIQPGDVNAAVDSMRKGALDCLAKPANLDRLRQLVEGVFNRVHETIQFGHLERRLAGYDLICQIGDGSMGAVYLATRGEKRFAVKLLRVDATLERQDREEMRERFLREAQVCARLRHPNIVRIVEYGLGPGQPYIVMELLRGVSLLEVHARHGGLTYGECADIIRQVAQALDTIHRAGVCHRDIKPGNIIVDDDLLVKLTDFGIALVPESDLTWSDELLGSPAYMAPESFTSTKVSPQADLFSLGSVAYEFMLGRLPFPGGGIGRTADLICTQQPPAPASIDREFPPPLEAILAGLLSKGLESRYMSAGEVVSDLTAFVEERFDDITRTEQDTRRVFDSRGGA